MKAIVDSVKLAKELKKVSPVIKRNTVLPILSSVMLHFENNKLTIKATDLETIVLSTIGCECKNEFDLVIDFAKLADICSRISEPITIDVSGDSISITSSSSKFKFSKTNEQEHYPKLPETDFSFTIDVDFNFFWSLSCANSCKSTNDLQTNMNAACIHIKKDSLTVVGIDGYVAYKNTLKIKTGKEAQLLVCDQFVQMVKSFNDAKVSIGDKFIKVETEGIIIISRLLDARFCGYETIMPESIKFNFKIDRVSLIHSLAVTGVAASAVTHFCSINFNGGDLKIVSKDIDFGTEGETLVKANHQVDFPEIGLNGNQMLKLLNLFDSEEIEMSFTGENKTIYLRPSGEPNVICLIQPLAL